MLKKTIFVYLLSLWTVASFAQQYEWKTATSNGYTYKYVTNDPMHARFYTLKNGLTVILAPASQAPRIQAYIAVKAGSKTDPATNTGLAHYLEHMMFKGTDKYGSLDWEKEKKELDKIYALYEKYNKTTDEVARKSIYRQIDSVSNIAAKYAIANEYDKMMSQMGAQGTNAFTSFEQTVYTDDIPNTSIDKYLAVQAERFRNPVLRIFHTELEAVYEEKNRSLDNDGDKVFETLFANLFKKHNYGKQTTIGTIEHLKNPSLVEIEKYFNTYYVPNNMGIIMAGDFNPDEVIKKIDQNFAYMQSKVVPKYEFEQEDPITTPIVKEIVGPDAESITMAFRLPGNKDKDVLLSDLVGAILTNGEAGLLDLNLVKQQKLLRASAAAFTLIDHGVLYLNAAPTAGQSLENVQQLILQEIENLKKGNFDDNLIPAIINNLKKEKIIASEKYGDKASILMQAFTAEQDWQEQVAYINNLAKITKQQVVDFANKYFSNNYVAILKRKGEAPATVKIEKPAITPVETNPTKQSAFLQAVNAMPSKDIAPKFLDYNKEIQKGKLGKAEVLYIQNKENSIYRLSYRYKIGSLHDLKHSIAAIYLQYLGTKNQTAEEITKAFYQIASSFNVSTSDEYTYVTIEGLQENFNKAVQLYENLIANIQPNEEALTALKLRIEQARTMSKANKASIMNALHAYATYGAKNKITHTLSAKDLSSLTAAELVQKIKDLHKYEQTIIYYGPTPLNTLIKQLSKVHKLPASFKTTPRKATFTALEQSKNKVLFTHYDMVQAETRWVRNTGAYNVADVPLVNIYNNYFGGGMSTIVFQTIRESKALAYSTFALYITPSKKEDNAQFVAYVGSQADKFNEATVAMNELINHMPSLPVNFEMAKTKTLNAIETQRILKDDIIFNYLAMKALGLNYDVRKLIYNTAKKATLADIEKFQKEKVAQKPYTYIVLASKDKINKDELAALGDIQELTLEEIFGY